MNSEIAKYDRETLGFGFGGFRTGFSSGCKTPKKFTPSVWMTVPTSFNVLRFFSNLY